MKTNCDYMNMNNNDVTVYILTHKKIIEKYDENLYKPLLNGSSLLDEDYGYIRDDYGDNLSKLNPYLAELTGEYWAWKNSKSKIIGFCHYRRWFVKNIFLEKLTKEDIKKDLENYDIILPIKTKLLNSVFDEIKISHERNPNYGPKIEDYYKLEEYIKKNQNEYYDTYKQLMNSKEAYYNTIFICRKELSDEYFNWLFSIFNELKHEIDFSSYPQGNKRVFAFFCEILLNIYVKKNNLKIKEYDLYFSERKVPLMAFINKRYPKFTIIERKITDLMNTFK